MLDRDYMEWDECPEVDKCELIYEFLELIDSLVRDIQHLKAEAIRAKYELSEKYDPEHEWITTCDLLSGLDMPHYESIARVQLFGVAGVWGGAPHVLRQSPVTQRNVYPAYTGFADTML